LLGIFLIFVLLSGIVPSIFLEAFHLPVSVILDRLY
jgi:hypothetical protein